MTEPDFGTAADLVASHRALVGHVVRDITSRLAAGLDTDHLVRAGLAGLRAAAATYEVGDAVTFARYASTRVRGAVVAALCGAGSPPADRQAAAPRLAPTSTRRPAGEVARLVATARERLVDLPPQHRFVLEEYFLAGRPLAEVAAELEVTEHRASEVRAEALALLAQHLRPLLAAERHRP